MRVIISTLIAFFLIFNLFKVYKLNLFTLFAEDVVKHSTDKLHHSFKCCNKA